MMQDIPTFAEMQERLLAIADCAHRRDVTVCGTPISAFAPSDLVSIVTVSYNSAEFIRETIESVLRQTHSGIEYILIDGGSTDGTVEIIRDYSARISYWHSLPDGGISDAFNLGIAASSGGLIALVNADDWLSPGQVQAAAEGFRDGAADFVFGALDYHAIDGQLLYHCEGDPNYLRRIRYEMPMVNHPTLVAKRETYERVGLYDRACRIAMDYDWFLRAALKGMAGAYVPSLVGHLRRGGVSSNNVRRGLREVRDIALRNGVSSLRPTLVYYFRVVRLLTRVAMTKVLPARLVDRLHRSINSRYRSVVPGGASR